MQSEQKAWIDNVPFDELKVGQSASLSRTLSQADISAFAEVSGDTNPAHLDAAYAESTRFHGVIAHGLWGGSLISALLGTRLPGAGSIYLEQSFRFSAPAYPGDHVTATVTVLRKHDHSGQVEMACELVKSSGERILYGLARLLAPKTKVRIEQPPQSGVFDAQACLHRLIADCAGLEPVACAVVHPCDLPSLQGALEAARAGLIRPIIYAPEAKLRPLLEACEPLPEGFELLAVEHSHAAAEYAAQAAAEGRVRMIMKGSLHTDELVRAVLARPELRTGRRMSHVFRFDVPRLDRPLFITDAALNIAPDLAAKADILQNAIDFSRALGLELPRVAVLAAVETVTPAMTATIDAAALCKMAHRGQIKGGIVDGPLAFDNAINLKAAQTKGIESAVAGQADILLVPDLESGNMLAKQLEYLAGAFGTGIMLGARVPVVLTSRADGMPSRVGSTALALRLWHAQRS